MNYPDKINDDDEKTNSKKYSKENGWLRSQDSDASSSTSINAEQQKIRFI